MARMTKEEKMALETMAKQGAWNEFRAGYPERFANLMYQFMVLREETQYEDLSFRVKKLDTNTYFFDGDGPWHAQAELMVTLPEEPVNGYVWDFENLEALVNAYHERKQEEARQAAVKQEAMKKLRNTLNAEELKLLGF